MKTIKIFLTSFIILSSVNADEILNDLQKTIYIDKEKQGQIEGKLQKDSWINPLVLEMKQDKTKNANSEKEIDSKNISVGFSQDIFRSGAIYQTIKKGKIETKLNSIRVKQEKKVLSSKLYEYVINLQKIDLQIKKAFYLIKNKKIEIEKNEASYTNGIIDITILDESVIELSELKNSKENLNIQKIETLRELQKYSDLSYQDISLDFLSEMRLNDFIANNINIKVQELEYRKTTLEKDIVSSSYFPKISVYGAYGYEDSSLYTKNDDYYNYGVKLSIPIDYNTNKNKEISQIKSKISNHRLTQMKKDEVSFYNSSINIIAFINKKIINVNQTIKRYTNLYTSVNSLYQNSLKTIDDVSIMENRVASNILEKQILELDKKLVINNLYSKFNI